MVLKAMGMEKNILGVSMKRNEKSKNADILADKRTSPPCPPPPRPAKWCVGREVSKKVQPGR